MADPGYHQHSQQQFGQQGLSSNLPGGFGGGDDPSNRQGNDPERDLFANMDGQQALTVLKMAGVRDYHTHCLMCLQRQSLEHRRNWLRCPNLCAFCPANQQHRHRPCPKWLSVANYEWCILHGGNAMQRFKMLTSKERAARDRKAQQTGPPRSPRGRGDSNDRGYDRRPRQSRSPKGRDDYSDVGYHRNPRRSRSPRGRDDYSDAGYYRRPRQSRSPRGRDDYNDAGYHRHPRRSRSPRGRDDYNDPGYHQYPRRSRSPRGRDDYNDPGYHQYPRRSRSPMGGGIHSRNPSYQAPSRYEGQRGHRRESSDYLLSSSYSTQGAGKRHFNGYNSDRQSAYSGRDPPRHLRSLTYGQREESRGRSGFYDARGYRRSSQATGENLSPVEIRRRQLGRDFGARPMSIVSNPPRRQEQLRLAAPHQRSPAPAQNAGDTQAQIAALMRQVQELQQQMNSTQQVVVEQRSEVNIKEEVDIKEEMDIKEEVDINEEVDIKEEMDINEEVDIKEEMDIKYEHRSDDGGPYS